MNPRDKYIAQMQGDAHPNQDYQTDSVNMIPIREGIKALLALVGNPDILIAEIHRLRRD